MPSKHFRRMPERIGHLPIKWNILFSSWGLQVLHLKPFHPSMICSLNHNSLPSYLHIPFHLISFKLPLTVNYIFSLTFNFRDFYLRWNCSPLCSLLPCLNFIPTCVTNSLKRKIHSSFPPVLHPNRPEIPLFILLNTLRSLIIYIISFNILKYILDSERLIEKFMNSQKQTINLLMKFLNKKLHFFSFSWLRLVSKDYFYVLFSYNTFSFIKNKI